MKTFTIEIVQTKSGAIALLYRADQMTTLADCQDPDVFEKCKDSMHPVDRLGIEVMHFINNWMKEENAELADTVAGKEKDIDINKYLERF